MSELLRDESFAAFVRERCEASVPLDSLYVSDLHLAYLALAVGDSRRDAAVRELEALTRRAAQAIVRTGDAADLAQRVLLLLLHGGPDGVPKLAQYAGRAPLGAWLRVVVMRLWERAAPEVVRGDDQLGDTVSTADDPELAYLKQTYRAAFRVAFASAVASLSFHDRMLLRQHYLDELGIDDLARLHRVHRSTCARWLASLREKVLAETRRRLQATLSISREELDAVLAVIASKLDVTISHLLPRT